MNTKRKSSLLAILIAMSMLLSVFPITAAAAPGDNLWVSETAWGQLIDPNGTPILPKGDQITIPVTLTSAQGTILVTTPGAGATDEEKSMPELDSSTGLYKNVVYIDNVNAPTAGSVYNYTFGFDAAMVTKGQKLYVKVGGTDVPAADNQKATTTYLGSSMPGQITDYSAANVAEDLQITTPSAVWTNPKVAVTISGESAPREISAGVTATDTLITVPNSALASAFSDLSLSQITVTDIVIIDSAIEDIALNGQNIAVNLESATPGAPQVTADDIANIIVNLDLGTMEYAVSLNNGTSYGAYSSADIPFLGGSKMVKVRFKAQGEIPAGPDTVLTFTANYGDVSGDGLIEIGDVIMTAEIAVGCTGYTSDQIKRANVNSKTDPTIDIGDVVLIAERAVGGVAAFPAERP